MLNSSSKSECIHTAWPLRMGIHHHLPGSLENGRRTEALPVLNVELPVELAQSSVPLHHEVCRCVVHLGFPQAYRVSWHVVQPALA